MKRSMILLAVAALIAATLAIAAPAAAKDGFPSWTPFDRTLGESPEGVAVDKTGNVYVSINPLGQVWKFAPDGSKSLLVDLPDAGAAGLAVDAMGNVYVARGLSYLGVWKVDRHGKATLVPGTDQIVLANALAFDHNGNLYVSETFSLDDPSPYDCALTGGESLRRSGTATVESGSFREGELRNSGCATLCCQACVVFQFRIRWGPTASRIAMGRSTSATLKRPRSCAFLWNETGAQVCHRSSHRSRVSIPSLGLQGLMGSRWMSTGMSMCR